MDSPEYPVTYYPKGQSSLAFLEPSVQGMFKIMDDYLLMYNRPGKPDRPFSFNERATLGLLAGGIWRSNKKNMVLEEYRANKQGTAGTYKGRYDIWFLAENQSCYGEAKQAGQRATGYTEKSADCILEVLHSERDHAAANAALSEFDAGEIQHVLGIFFIVPFIMGKHQSEAKNQLLGYSGALDRSLERFVSEQGCVVFRGSYLRYDLLAESEFFKWETRTTITFPGVDVLICEKPKR